MITVSAQELRRELKKYLNLLEKGEEVAIVRNSRVVGRMVPSDAVLNSQPPKTRTVQLKEKPNKLSTNPAITFRCFERFEDPEAVYKLHKRINGISDEDLDAALRGSDLLGPYQYYEAWGGEFWVGELDGQIVAMGGFRVSLNSDPNAKLAELKRLDVHPEWQGQGIEERLRELLEERARQKGYQQIQAE